MLHQLHYDHSTFLKDYIVHMVVTRPSNYSCEYLNWQFKIHIRLVTSSIMETDLDIYHTHTITNNHGFLYLKCTFKMENNWKHMTNKLFALAIFTYCRFLCIFPIRAWMWTSESVRSAWENNTLTYYVQYYSIHCRKIASVNMQALQDLLICFYPH